MENTGSTSRTIFERIADDDQEADSLPDWFDDLERDEQDREAASARITELVTSVAYNSVRKGGK